MAYSRLQSVEEKKNIRSAILMVFLTFVTLVALFFIGIPALGKFVGFVSDLGKSNKPISSTDTTPPPPPRFNTFNDFTNQNNVTLSGNTEAGATVKLTFNGNEQTTLSDKDGNFTFTNIGLNDGDNLFSAVAVDSAGNVSQKTQDYKIVFDKKAPDLQLTAPAESSSFFGSSQRQITIQGITESGVQITINGRIVAVDDTGKFQYSVSLNDGGNKFTVKATDKAGNTTEKELNVTFSP